ncbi:hypothetical protein OIDMADRAFT_66070, partial [Oidiodendron maius Zn]
THWAILIGINFYIGGKCLQGSVRDVQTVKQYLEAGPTPVDITILTATTPPDPGSRRPSEDPELWPTYKNVISTFVRVLEEAKAGDFVYIHYAGHGTREKSSERCAHQAGNLAFVLFEDDEHGCSYLKGPLLAGCLRKMVEKGLLVTVVLDCCYSGSVLRGGKVRGADVRAIDYNPAVDTASQQEALIGFCSPSNPFRNATIPTDQWLVNPEGYTILSACGPHERAWEIKIKGQKRIGALTYFLIEALCTLRKSGIVLTHQSLYQHVRIRFHASWPQQNPMCYGNKNFSFFGKLCIGVETAFVSIYRTGVDRLCLSAGEAHGVYKGDTYAIYPFDAPEDNAGQISEALVMVRVDTVRCLTSDLVEIGNPTGAALQIKTAWKARLVTSLSPQKIGVRLMASAQCQLQWRDAVEQQDFLRICTEEDNDIEPCIFNVAISKDRGYEILDGSLERIISLPTIPLDTSGASGSVIDILQHLATFKHLEGFGNRAPNQSFLDSFSLLPLTSTGDSGIFDIKHGGIWGFAVENIGNTPLYLAILNLTPSWQIVDLVSLSSRGDCLVVQPNNKENYNKEEIRLEMKVPEFLQSQGKKQCEDV